jgi:hypothetical protein
VLPILATVRLSTRVYRNHLVNGVDLWRKHVDF